MERKPMHKNPGGENDFCPTRFMNANIRAAGEGENESPIPGGMEWKS